MSQVSLRLADMRLPPIGKFCAPATETRKGFAAICKMQVQQLAAISVLTPRTNVYDFCGLPQTISLCPALGSLAMSGSSMPRTIVHDRPSFRNISA